MKSNNLHGLKTHFEPADIEFRAGATTSDKTKALALAYITSRAVMDRLDAVAGPANWKDEYQFLSDGVVCTLSLRIDGEWIAKTDGAPYTNFEGFKGGISDSLKRAAVKWGIGRYLYALPAMWVKATQRGNSIVVDEDEARAKMFGNQPSTPQEKDLRPGYIARITELAEQLHKLDGTLVDFDPTWIKEATLDQLLKQGKDLAKRVENAEKELT